MFAFIFDHARRMASIRGLGHSAPAAGLVVRARRRRGRRRRQEGGQTPISEDLSCMTARAVNTHISRMNKVTSLVGQPPYQPQDFVKLSTVLRSKYCSTKNYLCAMKRSHLRRDGTSSSAFVQAYSDAARHAVRKLGPPARAKPFRWKKIVIDYMLKRPIALKLRQPALMSILASKLLLRGIEICQARRRYVWFSLNLGTVTVLIPCSRTDAEGFGARLRFGCTCSTATLSRIGTKVPPANLVHLWLPCTYHAIMAFTLLVHGTLVPEGPAYGKQAFFSRNACTIPPTLEDVGVAEQVS